MKKKYETSEIEIIRIASMDVITASTGSGTETPVIPGENPFQGGYDSNGWT